MSRILIVDDDPAMRRMLSHIFEEEGFTVFTAANGLEALSFLQARASETDIVITDVMMPAMNGLALAETIKARNPHLPVLFLSACPEYLDSDTCGAVPMLTKPFEVTTLLKYVRRLLPNQVSAA